MSVKARRMVGVTLGLVLGAGAAVASSGSIAVGTHSYDPSGACASPAPGGPNAGLTNMGFETGDLTGWRQGSVVDDVAVTGPDAFTSPYEGSFMARLGGARASSGQGQPPGPNEICQDFVVDQAQEVFVYNMFTYDYTGFDDFQFRLMVVDPDTGEVIGSFQQGAWGSGTNIKTSGWKGVTLDLSAHLGETLRLWFTAGGTSDHLFAFWAYLDSAEGGLPPSVTPAASITSSTGSVTTDPQTGQITVAMPFAQPSDAAITVAIVCDTPPPSSVELLFNGASYPMIDNGNGTWSATVPQGDIENDGGGVLAISFNCGGQNIVNTIGDIVLYDPSGFVTDATSGNPVVGASVTLYQVPGWTPRTGPEQNSTPDTCESNDSKAPGAPWSQPAPVALGVVANPYSGLISPQVNPFITNSQGYYGWDVALGCWFVIVEKTGYHTLVSPVVGVPPEVTDLDLQLQALTSQQPGGDEPPAATPAAKGAKGAALKAKPKKVEKGDKTKLIATLSPCPASSGDTIELEMKKKGGWKTVGSKAANAACKAVFKKKVKKSSVFRASSPEDADQLAATSSNQKVKVKK